MSQVNKKTITFIIFLILLLLIGLFIKMTNFTPTNESQGDKIASLFIQFRDGTTEQEAKNILGNYNLTTYKIDYNVYGTEDRYYIMVDKDKIMDVRGELKK